MTTSGIAELDTMIAKLRELAGPGIGARVAAAAAPLVDAVVKKTVEAGTDPLGKAWKPTKKGGAPLQHAASHIRTAAQGPIVAVTLTGVEVFHHLGLGGMPRRQILPDGVSVGQGVKDAALEGARRVWREVVGG